MSTSILDIALLSLASFFGNIGVAMTGFGMAILFLFVWQLASLVGTITLLFHKALN